MFYHLDCSNRINKRNVDPLVPSVCASFFSSLRTVVSKLWCLWMTQTSSFVLCQMHVRVRSLTKGSCGSAKFSEEETPNVNSRKKTHTALRGGVDSHKKWSPAAAERGNRSGAPRSEGSSPATLVLYKIEGGTLLLFWVQLQSPAWRASSGVQHNVEIRHTKVQTQARLRWHPQHGDGASGTVTSRTFVETENFGEQDRVLGRYGRKTER